ncbi:MAG TPA: IS701 family transposase, partial [Ktedonobacterales bacterium]|nr:IS701 family transposase [Ktedonobacterales bacterium]
REPVPTVAFVDDYCAHYCAVFPNVRQFEQFTHLELGLVAETKRKSLPRLAQTTKADPQALHHFLAKAEWSVEALRAVRLELTRQALRERPFTLCIDETGDRKKGKTTDYAAHQYIGNVHTLANGVVSVNAYGVLDTVTFPLAFRLFKPQRRLKPSDVYKSKPQLAVELIEELVAQGFHFSVVLADSMYGESWDFTHALHRLGVQYVVAIRSNHGVWTFPGERVRQTRWRPFLRIFTDGTSEQRFICEFVFGKRGGIRYYVVTTDPVHLPPETTWRLMTNLPGKIERTVGNTFGLRTWIEYGFKQAKDELGWADYRLTDAHSIERWWELVMDAYLLVSLQAPALAVVPAGNPTADQPAPAPATASQHPAWTDDASWKHRLTNLRLFLQPFVCACLLLPWLRIHPLPHLSAGLADLCALMNTYHPLVPL